MIVHQTSNSSGCTEDRCCALERQKTVGCHALQDPQLMTEGTRELLWRRILYDPVNGSPRITIFLASPSSEAVWEES